MLPKQYNNISDFVSKHKYDKYRFQWVDIPVNSLYESSMGSYLLSDKATGRHCPTYKMMVNKNTWLKDPRSSCDPHNFKCIGSSHTFSDPLATGNTPFYIHFLVRGYLHTGIKVLEQRLPTMRGQTPHDIAKQFFITDPSLKNYPFRFLSACGEYCISHKAYLKHLLHWRIPLWIPDRKNQTAELYRQILRIHGINAEKELLVVDEFNLGTKIRKCNNIINASYIKFVSGRMPSAIGDFLMKTFVRKY